MSILILEDFKKNKRIYCKCQCKCGKIFEARKDNIISGHTASCGCQSSRTGKNLIGQHFNHLEVISKTDKRNSAGSIIWKCKCDCSDNSFIEVDTHSLLAGLTQSCGCLISKGEEKIAMLLSQNNIPFERQKTFESCRFPTSGYLAKFDFFVDGKYIIEFDGIQHFESVLFFKNNNYLTIKTRDDIKTQWCKENGIPLIRIPYTKLDTLTIEDLILNEEVD